MVPSSIDFNNLETVKEKIAYLLWTNLAREALTLTELKFGDLVYLVEVPLEFPKASLVIFSAVFIGPDSCSEGLTKLQTRLNTRELNIKDYGQLWLVVTPRDSIPLSPEVKLTFFTQNPNWNDVFKEHDFRWVPNQAGISGPLTPYQPNYPVGPPSPWQTQPKIGDIKYTVGLGTAADVVTVTEKALSSTIPQALTMLDS